VLYHYPFPLWWIADMANPGLRPINGSEHHT
jgi:hypothetical protein